MVFYAYPNSGDRMLEKPSGAPDRNAPARFYSDSLLTNLLTVYLDNAGVPGTAVTEITADGRALLPERFWVDGYDEVYVSANNGPAFKIAADASYRVDNMEPMSGYQMTPGYYVVPEGTRTTSAMLANTDWAIPIKFAKPGTLDRIAIDVTGAGTAGTVIRLGIRASGPTGLPDALMLDCGTVSGAAVAMPELTISCVIPRPGTYWLSAVPQATGGTLPTIRIIGGSGLAPCGSPNLAGALGASSTAAYSMVSVTGALPANYVVAARSGGGPLIAVRAV